MKVLLTGIRRDFDRELACFFVEKGHTVYALGGTDGTLPAVTFLPYQPFREGSARQMARALAEKAGWIDVFIDTSAAHFEAEEQTIRQGIDPEAVMRSFRYNALAPLEAFEAVLPLMDKGECKRACFISDHRASVNWNDQKAGFGPAMSKAALHNILQIAKNRLSPMGYTFRVYDPLTREADISPRQAAAGAYSYICRRRAIDPDTPGRDDERRLVLRDALGREWAW